jgi:hypothetical protein
MAEAITTTTRMMTVVIGEIKPMSMVFSKV